MEASFLQQGRLEKEPINRQTFTQTRSIRHLGELQRVSVARLPPENRSTSLSATLADPHQPSQQKHTFCDA